MKGVGDFVKNTKENLRERREAKPPKKPGKLMSKQEAEETKDTYYQALKAIFGFMDDVIRFTTGGHQEVEIWGTIDDDDVNIIVDARLAQAQRSVRAAEGVRRTIAFYEQMAVYIIVGPRVWQTLQIYAENGLDIPIHFRWPRSRRKLKVVPNGSQAEYQSGA